MIKAPELDRDVWTLIEEALRDPAELIKKLIATTSGLESRVESLDESETTYIAQLANLDIQAEKIWREQEQNDWPIEWVTRQLNRLKTQRATIQTKLARITERKADLALDRDSVEQFTATMASYRARMQAGLSFQDKATIVREAISGGTVETIGDGQHKTAKITIDLKWASHSSLNTNIPFDEST